MKKVLLATTALIGFAGAASAEIKLDGYAEIGVDGGNNVFKTQFNNDFYFNLNFSSESDSGLAFGGKVRIIDTNGTGTVNGTPGFDKEAFWVSGSFGKVTLGDTPGALSWAVPNVLYGTATAIYSGTSIADDHSTHAGAYWNTGMDGLYGPGGSNGQIARYEYSFGDFGVAGSVEMDNRSTTPTYTHQNPVVGIGAKWSGDLSGTAVRAGIGYQSNGSANTWSIAAKATMTNGFTASLGYAAFNSDKGADKILGTLDDGTVFTDYVGNGVLVDKWVGLGVAYTTGALTVGANYGMYSAAIAGTPDPKGWGLVANYDLGGGAVAMVGYGASNGAGYVSGNGHGSKTWSAGLGMI
jgi:outer membrane protein OmpU